MLFHYFNTFLKQLCCNAIMLVLRPNCKIIVISPLILLLGINFKRNCSCQYIVISINCD